MRNNAPWAKRKQMKQHNWTFTSANIENAIRDLADSFLPAESCGMEQKDCLALARLQVNRYLTDAPEYTDETSNTYKFTLAKGGKAAKRAEWSRAEKSKGGLDLSIADSAHVLGSRLGWLDQKTAEVEKALGGFVMELPAVIQSGLLEIWKAALKQREARAASATSAA